MRDVEFDALFTVDRPVVFAYHGYPWLIHRLTYRRTNHDNIHVRGYKEEGTVTTPFDMVMRNDLDRFHLASTSSIGCPAWASARPRSASRSSTSVCAAVRTPRSTARTRRTISRLDLARAASRTLSRAVLVLNAGSSSLKASIVAPPDETIARTEVSWGADASRAARRDVGVRDVLRDLGVEADAGAPASTAVGHRVVHGGDAVHPGDRIDDGVIEGIAEAERPRATPQRRGARDDRGRATGAPDGPARRLFRHGLPRDAPGRGVPLSRPAALVRRLGRAPLRVPRPVGRLVDVAGARELLGRDAADLSIVVAHLGSGCSVTAVRRRSIGRDLDGHDAARGPDDGDAVRLDRPWHRDAVAPRRAPHGRRARGHPRPCLGAPGRLRPDLGRASAPRRRGLRRRASDSSRSRCSCAAPRPPSPRRPPPCHALMRSSSPGASGRTARRSGTGSQAGSARSGWPSSRLADRVGVLAVEAREDLVIAAETVAATGHLRSDTA